MAAHELELYFWKVIGTISIIICMFNISAIRQIYYNDNKEETLSQIHPNNNVTSPMLHALPQRNRDNVQNRNKVGGNTNPAASTYDGVHKLSEIVIKKPLFLSASSLDKYMSLDQTLLLGRKTKRKKSDRPFICIGISTVHKSNTAHKRF